MADLPLTVDEQPPRGPLARASAWLRGRRVFLACCLAAVEVLAFIIWRPSALFATLFAALVLALCVMGIVRIAPGLGRDLLWIVGIAQALIVVLPLLIGFSIALGLVVALGLIVVLAVIAFRFRF